MTLLTKLLIAAGVLAALAGAAYLVRTSIYDDGYRAGLATAAKAIDNQRAEVARKNATIVKGDQALIVAKTEDKEKIVTIYRTIREQLNAQIIEVPVYRDRACVVPADGLRLIARAAAGGVPTDPPGAARDSAPATASPGK
jgi:hypothetical protein